MQLPDFDYHLPPGLIAQHPASRRDASRMLAVDRPSGTVRDDTFVNFPNYLREDDVLVLNNTRVFPARLLGVSETGARVEIFLVRKLSTSSWEALARPARRLKIGKRVDFDDRLTAVIVGRTADGMVQVEFECKGDLDKVLEAVGKTPLPPYIDRGSQPEHVEDRERYQTIYAKHSGAIAAPTAGLHFTPEVLAQIAASGIATAEITLHVGYGTFEPVRAVDDLSQHSVLPERYEIGPGAAEILNRSLRDGSRIVAVGTTTTRALETSIARHGMFAAGEGSADLTVTPGYKFRAVGALLTNFHLPKSSLLILVSTFGGHELIMDAYRHAVASRYRFYSYGDCMFIE